MLWVHICYVNMRQNLFLEQVCN